MPNPKPTRDLFAELYVAGLFADAGWHIYFPKRDFGFDFIVTKPLATEIIIRPVQVKGKYPTATKGDTQYYGYGGALTQLHPEMVLAIPFFASTHAPAPLFTAFMPRGQIRQHSTDAEWFQALPCRFRSAAPVQRRDYRKFFDTCGLQLMESPTYKDAIPENTGSA